MMYIGPATHMALVKAGPSPRWSDCRLQKYSGHWASHRREFDPQARPKKLKLKPRRDHMCSARI